MHRNLGQYGELIRKLFELNNFTGGYFESNLWIIEKATNTHKIYDYDIDFH